MFYLIIIIFQVYFDLDLGEDDKASPGEQGADAHATALTQVVFLSLFLSVCLSLLFISVFFSNPVFLFII